MKIMFLTMGEENLATGLLSSVLKEAGHETVLAHDPALFDERIYFHIAFLAKLFGQKHVVVEEVVKANPGLIAISVFSDNYVWADQIAGRIKKHLPDTPIIVGGIHITAVPEEALKNPHFDIICVGEGEKAIVELVDSMEKGEMRTDIHNLWFKMDGKIIRNEVEKLELDPEFLSWFDKDLFAPHAVGRGTHMYMTLATRGCPFHCTYCMQNFLRFRFNESPDKRRRSVDNLISELAEAKRKYNYKIVDFEDAVMPANKKWFLKFAAKYKEAIGVKYICMTHPRCMDDDIAQALYDSGCYRLQLGIQSLDEENRKKILRRPETNEDIVNCFKALDRHKVTYSVDHILGLPNERDEDHLLQAAKIYADCRYVHKFNVFWLTCFPNTEMVDIALKYNIIKPEYVIRINNGIQDFYYDHGITDSPELVKLFKAYTIFFRVMALLPIRFRHWMIDRKLIRYLQHLPERPTLFIIDLFMVILYRDPVSLPLLYSYLRNIGRILKNAVIGKGSAFKD